MKNRYLYIIMVVTIILGFWVRINHPGWFLVFSFIPLLFVALFHLIVQILAIRKASKMKSSYIALILLSNLFFFLGFAMQVDFGDVPGSSYPKEEGLWELFVFSSIAFLVALIISWILILFRGKSFRKNNIQEDSLQSPEKSKDKFYERIGVIRFITLALILIFAIFTWGTIPFMGFLIQAIIPTSPPRAGLSECVPPILDSGDGLVTTGCGTLEVGEFVTGTTGSTTEAHNWQFSAQFNNQIRITASNDGYACPQISILDSYGNEIYDNFKEEKQLGFFLCLEDQARVYYFDPPANGAYTLRLFTLETPGTYRLKIESE